LLAIATGQPRRCCPTYRDSRASSLLQWLRMALDSGAGSKPVGARLLAMAMGQPGRCCLTYRNSRASALLQCGAWRRCGWTEIPVGVSLLAMATGQPGRCCLTYRNSRASSLLQWLRMALDSRAGSKPVGARLPAIAMGRRRGCRLTHLIRGHALLQCGVRYLRLCRQPPESMPSSRPPQP